MHGDWLYYVVVGPSATAAVLWMTSVTISGRSRESHDGWQLHRWSSVVSVSIGMELGAKVRVLRRKSSTLRPFARESDISLPGF